MEKWHTFTFLQNLIVGGSKKTICKTVSAKRQGFYISLQTCTSFFHDFSSKCERTVIWELIAFTNINGGSATMYVSLKSLLYRHKVHCKEPLTPPTQRSFHSTILLLSTFALASKTFATWNLIQDFQLLPESDSDIFPAALNAIRTRKISSYLYRLEGKYLKTSSPSK